MAKKDMVKNKRKISPYWQIKLERFWFRYWEKPLFYYYFIFIPILIFFLILIYFAEIRKAFGGTDPEYLVAGILAVQSIFFIIQTWNIRTQTTYSRISHLPIIQVLIEEQHEISQFIIKIKNNGEEAKNVWYIINTSRPKSKDVIKKSESVFDLPKNVDRKLIGLETEKYLHKNLYIRVYYEDILNKDLHTLYKKPAGILSLQNISHSVG